MPANLTELTQQVSYLLDRTAISDLLIAFARAIDTKNWKAYEDLLTEDGIIEIPVKLPDGSFVRHVGRMGTAAWIAGNEQKPGLDRFVQTHHMSSNHQIKIEGDSASTHLYVQCIHRLNEDPAKVWELGGWYSCDLQTVGVHEWKFTKVHLDTVWEHGKPLGHG